jgi:hypothetical protein
MRAAGSPQGGIAVQRTLHYRTARTLNHNTSRLTTFLKLLTFGITLYEGREGGNSYGGEFQTQQEGRRGRDKKALKGVWQEVDCGRKEGATRRRGKGCGKK